MVETRRRCPGCSESGSSKAAHAPHELSWPDGEYKVYIWRRKQKHPYARHTDQQKRWTGTIKTTVYRKKAHTDQYLSFQSHHLLHQKLGVARTLLDRAESVITEAQDKEKEENHIRSVLKVCGYPEWTIKQVKENRDKKKEQKKK